jgi:hypothetical protein
VERDKPTKLDVVVTGNITAKICEILVVNLKKIAPWLPWQRPPF